MAVREEVRQYLQKILRESKGDGAEFTDGDSLVISGRLSSIDVVDLIVFLEGQFNFVIEPTEFDMAKFDSVNSIVSLVEQQS